MKRARPVEMTGSTEAVKLAKWYAAYARMGQHDRRMVAQIKSMLQRMDEGDVERLLRHHLSTRWRYRSQKPLEFALAKLPEYCSELGISLVDEEMPRAVQPIDVVSGLRVVA